MFYKEVEYKNPLYIATLENGVTVCVYDGYALGNDGKKYLPIETQVDDDFVFVGWEPED